MADLQIYSLMDKNRSRNHDTPKKTPIKPSKTPFSMSFLEKLPTAY
jgi:hypothetical protein